MGLPSGTFSSAFAGQLEVTFTGEFYSQSGGDWGSGGSRYLVLKCRVLQGGTELAVSYIKTGAPSATVTLAYPGGNTAWTISVTYESHSLGGPATVGVQNVRAACFLVKR